MPGGRFAGPKPGEIHFGHHRPAFGGQCLLADVGVLPRGTKNLLPATVLMVAAPAIVWLAYVVPGLPSSAGDASTAAALLLLLLCLGSLVMAWATEPGILHVIAHDRDTPQETWYIHDRFTDDEFELEQFRAKFCRETGNCIESFDHFCPWVGNAVGIRNYRYFVIFIGTASVLAAGIIVTTLFGITVEIEDGDRSLLQQSAVDLFLIIYSTVVFFTVFGLFGYHVTLIIKNQTTNEDLKKVYQNKRNNFDRGPKQNCVDFLWGSRRGSKVLETDNLEDLRLSPPLQAARWPPPPMVETQNYGNAFDSSVTAAGGVLPGRESLQAMM